MDELPSATSLNDLLSQLMSISEQSLDDHTQQRLLFFPSHYLPTGIIFQLGIICGVWYLLIMFLVL